MKFPFYIAVALLFTGCIFQPKQLIEYRVSSDLVGNEVNYLYDGEEVAIDSLPDKRLKKSFMAKVGDRLKIECKGNEYGWIKAQIWSDGLLVGSNYVVGDSPSVSIRIPVPRK